MPDLQALADRLEIEDVLTRYAWALDSKQFDELDGVFTPDAHLDYTSSGGEAGAYPDVKTWLAKCSRTSPPTSTSSPTNTSPSTVTAPRAASEFYNPMVMAKRDGTTSIFFVGGEYHDDLVRTPNGWRITNRVEKSIWTDGDVPTTATRLS